MSRTGLLVGICVAGIAVAGIVWATNDRLFGTAKAELLTYKVKVGTFIHEVTDRGEVQSSSNVDVVCQVQSQNYDGVAIIEIAPEGTTVKEGDFLVKLDDASLRTNLAAQQIAASGALAALTQAQNDLDAFISAKQEYELGTFKQDEEKLESEVFVAEENFRRAEEYLRYSEQLSARGYVTAIQLEADRFAVKKNQKELDVAKTKLQVLRDYTKTKTLKKHNADIKTAEAKVTSEQAKLQVEQAKLAHIETQVSRCIITAPTGGQVVYANEMQRWRGNEQQLIGPGAKVREQQVIIHLPDPKQMQVRAKVNEARIDLIKPGMPVTAQVDALPGVELRGKVKKVDQYPTNDNWFSQNVKQYATFIEIENPPDGLRPGMTAQVSIRVAATPNVLQAPVQAVVQRAGLYYCILPDGDNGLTARAIEIGPTNDKHLIVTSGLAADEEVLLNPRPYLADVGLPEDPDRKEEPQEERKPEVMAAGPIEGRPGT